MQSPQMALRGSSGVIDISGQWIEPPGAKPDFAVEHHACQLADQPIRLLEFRLHEPAPVRALQPPNAGARPFP
jgi:hypothetical protein